MLLTTAALCMALNIYHESRGEPLAGQHAVAQVTFNRADRNPERVCEEVFRPRQFSWADSLTTVSQQERKRRAKQFMPTDERAWNLARQIARHTLAGHIADFTKGATHYHTKAVRPVWRHALKLVAVIGDHKFYAYA